MLKEVVVDVCVHSVPIIFRISARIVVAGIFVLVPLALISGVSLDGMVRDGH